MPEEIKMVTVVCPACKSIKKVKKDFKISCEKCNRLMIEVPTDAAKKE